MVYRLSIDDLGNPHVAEVLLRLQHDKLTEQLIPYLRQRSWVTLGYGVLGLTVTVGAIGLAAWSPGSLWSSLGLVCLGALLGYALLLPLHEWIHALAYRWIGAERVRVRYDLKRLIAYCTADRQVVPAQEFLLVCVAPFFVLNAVLALSVAMSTGTPQLLLIGALWLHIAACSGDLALVQFLWQHRDTPIVTYDDDSAGESYFLGILQQDTEPLEPPEPPFGLVRD